MARCYCLLSKTPVFGALFAVLYAVLRDERLQRPPQTVVRLEVTAPDGRSMPYVSNGG